MLSISRTFLATLISAVFLPTAFADESDSDSVPEIVHTDQCIAPEKKVAGAPEETVNIEADSINAKGRNEAVYQGDVIVTQGHKKITADTVTVKQSENSVFADGNVTMNDGQIKSTSNKVKSDLKGDRIELHDTQYKFLCQTARGEAAYILKDGQSIYNMEDGSLTTCPEGNKSWRVKASDIDIDNNEEEATFYNTRFEILDVPVFYWPYITVPIGDKRKTGFLYPSGGYDTKNGLELNVPIYFNLAPNYDLTTTINYMEKRGVQFDNEFRYLTDGFGSGTLNFEYLNSDDLNPDEGARWGVNLIHNGIYERNWKFSIDYSRVSDNNYFDDLDSNIGNREDGQLLQSGEVAYRTDFSETTLKVRDFQVLSSTKPYRLMPQLQYQYHQPSLLPHLDFEWDSHISRFETDDDNLPDATRVHLEPSLLVPFYAPWGQLTSEAKLMYTYYDQDLKDDKDPDLKENVQRVVPEYRISGTIFMDNSQQWLGGYTQTLEPRIQYLYIPEVDQSDIYQGYDTTLLQSDYYGLFRDTKYSSVDYIAPANQLSYGATSRFYDDNYKERFNLSLGQIYYINPTSDEANLSAWALENEWNISDSWLYKGGLQYDSNVSTLQLANSTVEYKIPTGGYAQLNYRYISKSYIQDNAPGISDSQLDKYTRDGISQAGVLTSFNVAQRWSVQANYYHDLTENDMLESLLGVTYNDDCWFLGLTFSRHILSSTDVSTIYPEPGPEYESKVSLNIGIKGLGQSSGVQAGDGGNSLGYGRPFSLDD
ncbi:LPS assembly protein LptD [Vibrio rumoiensis]|uniref:LPS-assembly protein LptD n=1 Tax=Vibrio rumoiensis 1S-45 TaxID=1188252 RepID=A0A1E5DYT2_9VIBR|nr:LPS assembly protein LptD [Vibrio rumoiensis]OEF22970.1 LPS assembly protein LptD [Vibrio rumoiensis 1S-45]